MENDRTEEDGFFATTIGKVLLFFLPFWIGAVFIYLLYIIIPDESVFWLLGGGISTYFFPPFGKESVIPFLIGELNRRGTYNDLTNITLVGGTIAFVDVVTSYFLLYNFYIAEKIPFLGDWIKKFEDFGASKMKEKKWISNIAFLGVALFVVFPFQGSGGVGASILGKVMGMDKYRAWIAIIIGAFSGCFMISLLANFYTGAVISAFKSSVFKGIGLLALGIVVFIFIYYFSKNHIEDSAGSE